MKDQRVLVVGASAGIGKGIATRLVALGANVVFAGRREDALRAAVDAAGGGSYVVADLADPKQCDMLVEETVRILGGLDVLVVSASSSRLTLMSDVDADEYHRLFASNVVAPNLVLTAAAKHLPEGAVVAMLSSESVGDPLPGLAAYATTKAALDELVRAWRNERPDLRLTIVTVGSTGGTDFTRDFDMGLAGKLLPQWIAMGKVKERSMEPDDLGAYIADVIALNVAHPGLDCQQVTVRPPGPLWVGDAGRGVAAMKSGET